CENRKFGDVRSVHSSGPVAVEYSSSADAWCRAVARHHEVGQIGCGRADRQWRRLVQPTVEASTSRPMAMIAATTVSSRLDILFMRPLSTVLRATRGQPCVAGVRCAGLFPFLVPQGRGDESYIAGPDPTTEGVVRAIPTGSPW